MNHIALRLAAAILTPLLVLHPHAAQCAPATPVAPTTQTAHSSIVSMGSGPAIVLIPGLASPRAVWDDVAPDLAKTHRVLLVQINGFDGGDPQANTKPGMLAGVIADLDAYLIDNRIAAPKIVGHSLGGLVALMFAKAHPDHVSSLMIVDSLPYFALVFDPNATVASMEPVARGLAAQVAAGYGKPVDMTAQTANAQRLALKPESVAKVAAWSAKADPRAVAQGLYEDLTTDLRPDMAKIATPITLVYPWSDGAPKAMIDGIYHNAFAAAPHVDYVAIGDARHFVMLDQPAAFAAALQAFAG